VTVFHWAGALGVIVPLGLIVVGFKTGRMPTLGGGDRRGVKRNFEGDWFWANLAFLLFLAAIFLVWTLQL
jgi:hypothetical protein